MSLILLRSFVEVYRQGSVSLAAKALGLTQPAVSSHIASLEQSLGRKLFTRHSRGVRPTAVAEDLARQVGDAIDTAESALANARARSASVTGMIRICGPSDILSKLIVDRTAQLVANEITVHLRPSQAGEYFALLLDGSADFAFAVVPPDDPRVDHRLFGTEELVLVAPASLAPATPKDLGQLLSKMPSLAYDQDRFLVEVWLQHNEIECGTSHDVLLAPDLSALRNYAAAGSGWSVLPRYMVTDLLDRGTLVELTGPHGNPVTDYYLIWTKSAMRNPLTAKAKSLLLPPADRA